MVAPCLSGSEQVVAWADQAPHRTVALQGTTFLLTPALPDILTCKDAAALLSMHPKVIARMAQSKELPAFKIHRSWRFRRVQVLQWLASHQEAT
jgi:excisionase family DNA binding protein